MGREEELITQELQLIIQTKKQDPPMMLKTVGGSLRLLILVQSHRISPKIFINYKRKLFNFTKEKASRLHMFKTNITSTNIRFIYNKYQLSINKYKNKFLR